MCNCLTWAVWQRGRHGARIRLRWSDYGPWPHASVTYDGGRTYWSLVPRDFTQREWMRRHKRPPLWFRGRVVRDFRSNEGMNG